MIGWVDESRRSANLQDRIPSHRSRSFFFYCREFGFVGLLVFVGLFNWCMSQKGDVHYALYIPARILVSSRTCRNKSAAAARRQRAGMDWAELVLYVFPAK